MLFSKGRHWIASAVTELWLGLPFDYASIVGQFIAHVYTVYKDEISYLFKAIYNYIAQGILTICNMEPPKEVKYKEWKKYRKELGIAYAYWEVNLLKNLNL